MLSEREDLNLKLLVDIYCFRKDWAFGGKMKHFTSSLPP